MSVQDQKSLAIRDCFKHEERDFTPWLASRIHLLGSVVGLNLVVEQIEKACGPYSADIVAKDAHSGRYVIIENQFGKSNHDHLGKLLTYAAYHNATAIIWISERFTAEHIEAMAWLQRRIENNIAFFPISVEVFKDESGPIVNFRQATSIDAHARRQDRSLQRLNSTAIEHNTAKLSHDGQLRKEFWTRVREKLLIEKTVADVQAAAPVHYFDIYLGRAGFSLSNIISTREHRMNVRLYLQKHVADAAVRQLLVKKDRIELAFGEGLIWNPRPADGNKSIGVQRNANLSDRDKWPEYIDWMSQHIAKFIKVFGPKIQELEI